MPLTCHSGVRAGTADVERRGRLGYASGDAVLGKLDAGLCCAQRYNVQISPSNFMFPAGGVAKERGKVGS